MSANVLVQIVALALSPIITRLYSPSDFGHLAIFMTIVGLFVIFSTARLEFAIILPKKNEDANALIKLAFITSILISFLSFIAVYFFQKSINSYFKIDIVQNWLILIPLTIFFISAFNILSNYNNRLKKYAHLAIGQSILGISNPLIAIGISFQKMIDFGLLKAILFSNFLSVLFLSKNLFKENTLTNNSNMLVILKKYYRFPMYNMPHAFLNFFSSSLPVFMLTPAFGDYAIGLFTMALGKVFKPINLLGNSIYQVLSKKIVDDIQAKKPVLHQVTKLISALVAIGIIPFATLFFFAPEIFSFVFGAEWKQAGIYLQYLLPWLFMVYITGTLSFIPNLLKQHKVALIIELVYLVFRFLALQYGINQNSIILALKSFSIAGFCTLFVTLLWYLFLINKADKAQLKIE